MKIERLLAMTIMLLNRKKMTAKDLADYFEVSVRTIYRDVETLNQSNIPIVSYQGYDGGFCIPDHYKLSRQLLTFSDMLSILTTLKGVNQTLKNKDDIQAVVDSKGMDKMIDEATGFTKDAVIKWADWVTVNHWGEEI